MPKDLVMILNYKGMKYQGKCIVDEMIVYEGERDG